MKCHHLFKDVEWERPSSNGIGDCMEGGVFCECEKCGFDCSPQEAIDLIDGGYADHVDMPMTIKHRKTYRCWYCDRPKTVAAPSVEDAHELLRIAGWVQKNVPFHSMGGELYQTVWVCSPVCHA